MPRAPEQEVTELFRRHAGSPPDRLEALPPSGSARRYYRLALGDERRVATYSEDTRENHLFIYLSRHFRRQGLRVPEVLAVDATGRVYLQEDLGDTALLDVIAREHDRLSPGTMELYRQALAELARFQTRGHEGLDYSACIPRPCFDATCVTWDLNYYKYCYLRLAAVPFDEQRLEEDFARLTSTIVSTREDGFMYRDFQSRNIMVKEGTLHFIDYQGGRRGPLPYDVVSLLHDPLARIPDEQRVELSEHYLSHLARLRPVDTVRFRVVLDHFALLRLLQAMGAFGLRGLHERKPQFLASIHPGLHAILSLFIPGHLAGLYPEIERAMRAALQ